MGSLDNLAANGVIDFDAEAYVKGLPPRFIGHQENYIGLPGEMPLMAEPPIHGVYPGAHLSGHPAKDGFEHHKDENDNPSWKKALMTVLLTGLAVVGAVRYRGKIVELFNKKKAAVTSPSFKQKVSDFFSNAKTKIVEFFKGPSKPANAPAAPAKPATPAPQPATPAATPAASTTATTATTATTTPATNATPQAPTSTPANAAKPAKKGTWANIPNWAKYSGIGAATLLGLYSIYKALSGGREQAPHE